MCYTTLNQLMQYLLCPFQLDLRLIQFSCTTLGREKIDLGPKPRVDFQNH